MSNPLATKLERHIREINEAFMLLDEERIKHVVNTLKVVRAAGGTVWLAGNGGSAATASHFSNDLTKMGHVKAIAISDLTPTTLAYGNDNGWDQMFAHALEMHIGPKDAVIGISCSGNSKNIVAFLAMAKSRYKIAFTGPGYNRISKEVLPDILVQVMSDEITVIEDVHSAICHAIARSLQDEYPA
jgi:D-sedoheptulose 7-phosphate isomerase